MRKARENGETSASGFKKKNKSQDGLANTVTNNGQNGEVVKEFEVTEKKPEVVEKKESNEEDEQEDGKNEKEEEEDGAEGGEGGEGEGEDEEEN